MWLNILCDADKVNLLAGLHLGFTLSTFWFSVWLDLEIGESVILRIQMGGARLF